MEMRKYIHIFQAQVTTEDLISILKRRHLTMMPGRAEEVNAGEFKILNNRAGNTEFVDFYLNIPPSRMRLCHFACARVCARLP
ncbi:MAG: hypothetical protein LBG15_07610 [Dysgonamonadaceae bacterium]|jgi:hypothetical protein|nr:hypothetical protein [Dysgonamonadaceae bacterium]